MNKINLNKMIGGWFIGNFEPSIHKTTDFEVGIKNYKKGECVEKHYHKIALEYTIIIEGEAIMNGIQYNAGEVIKVEPFEVSDFKAITDVKSVVVKIPSVINDKYKVND